VTTLTEKLAEINRSAENWASRYPDIPTGEIERLRNYHVDLVIARHRSDILSMREAMRGIASIMGGVAIKGDEQ
jgi:hypothetical protein